MPVGRSLQRTYPVEPASVPRARHDLTNFAAAQGARKDELARLRLAVSEAMTAAVLRAGGDARAEIRVSARVGVSRLSIVVRDHGQGAGARSSHVGSDVGLRLISELVNEMKLVQRPHGATELRMRIALARTRTRVSPRGPRVPGGSRRQPTAPAAL